MVVRRLGDRSAAIEGVQHQAHDERSEDGHDHGSDTALGRSEAHLPGKPATDDATDHADHDIQ